LKRIKVLDQSVILLVLIIWKNHYLKLLNVEEEIGVTERYGKCPHHQYQAIILGIQRSSISDLKDKEDQVIDYAKRRSVSTEVAMKWLNPNIAVDLGN
jgi:5-methyltetrahydrofolate--homocysteine methyltransferase